MDDMAHDAAHALTRSPGIGRLSTTRSDRRGSLHGYSGKWTRPVRPEGPETRGTAACCIRSKSSRFYVHPFREGNGRTQRVFWNRVARDAGWQLDWRGVHGSTNDQACRAASVERDFAPLREMLGAIVTTGTPAAERDAARWAAERARLSFATRATDRDEE